VTNATLPYLVLWYSTGGPDLLPGKSRLLQLRNYFY